MHASCSICLPGKSALQRMADTHPILLRDENGSLDKACKAVTRGMKGACLIVVMELPELQALVPGVHDGNAIAGHDRISNLIAPPSPGQDFLVGAMRMYRSSSIQRYVCNCL